VKELEKYSQKYPKRYKDFSTSNVSYLGVESSYSVSYLTKVFNQQSNKLKLKLVSELTWQDIQQNNIIFVGSIKTIRNLNYLFNYLRFNYNLFPHTIYYTPTHADTVNTFTLVPGRRGKFFDDYSIIAKCPGSHNNTIMLIVSFSSFGTVESMKRLLSPSFENVLIKDKMINKEIPKYFETLFKVKGIEGSGFNTDILYFHKINPEEFLNNHEERKVQDSLHTVK
jgi:hypothetical protein